MAVSSSNNVGSSYGITKPIFAYEFPNSQQVSCRKPPGRMRFYFFLHTQPNLKKMDDGAYLNYSKLYLNNTYSDKKVTKFMAKMDGPIPPVKKSSCLINFQNRMISITLSFCGVKYKHKPE